MVSKTPSRTHQTTEVKFPAWVEKASQENYDFAKQVANRPLEQYGGPLVAPISQYTQQAWDIASQGAGAGADNYAAINKTLQDLMDKSAPLINTNFTGQDVNAQQLDPGNYTADQVRAGQFTDLDLDAYMNPYIQNVENQALGALDEQRIKALMGNADKAIASRSFGGSRSAIVDAVTNAEAAKHAGLLSADLRRQGFDAATALATGDLNRTLQGDLANQAANLTASQMQLAAGQSNQAADLQAQLANQGMAMELQKLGFSAEQANQIAEMQARQQQQAAAEGLQSSTESQQRERMQDFASLISAGAQQQQHEQSQIQADLQQFLERRDYPVEQLNILMSSLGMSPYGKSESAQKTSQGGSSGMDPAMMGLGIAQMLPFFFGLLSDREDKTDIKKLGKDPNTGLDLYAYRYKGDPKSYPKVVGPMAQDIERKYPQMAGRVGGHRVVRGALAGA